MNFSEKAKFKFELFKQAGTNVYGLEESDKEVLFFSSDEFGNVRKHSFTEYGPTIQVLEFTKPVETIIVPDEPIVNNTVFEEPIAQPVEEPVALQIEEPVKEPVETIKKKQTRKKKGS